MNKKYFLAFLIGITMLTFSLISSVTAWGNLEPYLINQTNRSVIQYEFFNFSSGVTCVGGECGNVSATLDPKKITTYKPSNEILLKSRKFVPDDLKKMGKVVIEKTSKLKREHILIQFDKLLSKKEREKIEKKGIKFLRYLPNKAWLVSIPTNKILDINNVRWYGKLKKEDKISLNILKDDIGRWSINPDGDLTLLVQFYPDVEIEKAKETIILHNGQPGNVIKSINTVVVKIPKSEIDSLADQDEIMWIGEFPPPLEPINDEAREVTGAEELQEAPYNLNGTGIIVYVYDGGMIESTHGDLTGRVTLAESGSAASHATHVACTVGGTGARSENFGGTYLQWRGMAPNVTIISGEYDSCTPYCLYNSSNDIEEDYNYSIYTYDVDIATNSIGSNVAPNGYPCEWEGDYELTSQLVDGIIRGNLGKPLTGVWANGNERSSGRCGTSYSTTAPPATMKNSISVGATDKDDTISYYTSFGPTDDGRLKPDVTAPGTSLYSCTTGNSYTSKSGTSMATPTTTGNVALMMQTYRQNHSGVMLPSTVKALLIHTAKDLGNQGPDYQFGYGRINSTYAISLIQQDNTDNKLIFEKNITSQGDSQTFFVDVPESINQFKLTLVWTDYPGTPLVQIELVNDLDLVVTSPNGTRFYPWTLNSSNPSLNAVKDKEDHLNNVEQVLVDSPESGKWTIIISGTVVPEGPQDFSLISDYELYTSKGTVLMNEGTPFYTTSQNPVYPQNLSCLQNMQDGDSCNQTWVVNATGDRGNYTFYTIYNSTTHHQFIPSNETDKITITIIDTTFPVITNVQNISVTHNSAVITWDTDDSSNSTVYYGTSPSILTSIVNDSSIVTDHTISLLNLDSYTVYYYNVSSCNLDNYCSISSTYSFKTLPKPISISQIQCEENNSAWGNCSNLVYNDSLTNVRANCTSDDGNITNVSLKLVNVPDNNTFFDNNATYSNDWWIYNNADINIQDSGLWNLSVVCQDNLSQEQNNSSTWTVTWGRLESYLINQTNKSVSQYELFNFSSGVSCVGGECGNISATLDPELVTSVVVNDSSRISVTMTSAGSRGGATDHSTYIWRFNGATLYKYNISGGSPIESETMAYSDFYDITYDGTFIWGIRSSGPPYLIKMYTNGSTVSTYTAESGGGIAYDNRNSVLWVRTAPTTIENYSLSGVSLGGSKSIGLTANYGIDYYNGIFCTGSNGVTDVDIWNDNGTKLDDTSDSGVDDDQGCAFVDVGDTHFIYAMEGTPVSRYTYTCVGCGGPGKGVIPMNNGTPFYTTNQNPVYPANLSCLVNMKPGDTCNQTWTVNATGSGSYNFYTTYNPITYSNYIDENETEKINISIVDITPPIISNVQNVSVTHNSATINWTTNELANSTVYYGTTKATNSTSGSASLTTSHSVALSSLSNLTLYYYNVSSCDASGNCNTSSQYNFTTSADITAPIITFEYPVNGTSYNDYTGQINVSINEDGGNCSLNDTRWDYTTGNKTFFSFINNTAFSDEDYTINVSCWDDNNNNGSKILSFTLDTITPNINFTDPTPANGTYLQSYIPVNVTASDTNLDTISISIYNSNDSIYNFLLSSNTSTTSPFFVNFTSLSDGTYHINATANDTANNINSTETRNITLDTTAPNITNIASSVTSSSATITWNTNEQANSTVYYGINTATTSVSSSASLTTTHSITLSSLSSSRLYYYNVSSCDATGNCNTSSQYDFTTSAAGDGGIRGGGGGGGGGAVAVAKVSKRWNYIASGGTATMEIKKSELALTELSFTVIKNVNTVEVSVEKLFTKPSAIERNVKGEVYKYLKIEKTNLKDSNIKSAEAKFEVERSWLDENAVDENKVYLYRFINDWEQQSTNKVSANKTHVRYRSKLSGLSYFAIAGTELCIESWECTKWSECKQKNYMERTCIDKNKCGTTLEKPKDRKDCWYITKEAVEEKPEIITPKISVRGLLIRRIVVFVIILIAIIAIADIILREVIKKKIKKRKKKKKRRRERREERREKRRRERRGRSKEDTTFNNKKKSHADLVSQKIGFSEEDIRKHLEEKGYLE